MYVPLKEFLKLVSISEHEYVSSLFECWCT